MTEETPLDWMIRANKPPRGKRPDFFGDPDKERMLSMLMALVGEVSVLSERLDTVERLLEAGGTLKRGAIETFEPDKQAAYERGAMIREYIARIMRGPQQMMESMARDEPTIEEVSRQLRDS